ncbi:unnamed protein product [Dovyalis caffra]|uniref:Uncharacterized protein n=1 Tax=Dovyalis caffra TaxID=77055 RepID=A0AAV1QR41_9ROSI|nr:unnamed protein product [Dovyalis caffra]
MKKAEVVFIPAPAMGHILALVEVAKLLVRRDDRLSATVFIMHPTLDLTTTKYSESLTASTLPGEKPPGPVQDQDILERKESDGRPGSALV